MPTDVKETLTIGAKPDDLKGATVLDTLAGSNPSVEKISASMALAAEYRKALEEKSKSKKKTKKPISR